jgi:FAD/FMN-containing dehydrogenase
MRGGSGNFGIATSFEYEVFPVGPMIQGGAIAWRASDAPAVLRALRQAAETAPRSLALVGALRLAPPAPWLPKDIHGQPMVAVFVCHTGPREALPDLLAPLRATGTVVADTVVDRPYTGMQSLLDATQPKGRRYYWKSEYLPGLDDGFLDAAIARLGTIPSPHSGIVMFQLEGALNELPPEHSPAGNRDARFVCNVTSAWDQPADDAANLAWTRASHEAIRGFSTGGVYLNFLSEDEGAERVAQAYGAANLARLGAIKRKWDPTGLFRHTKAVG